MTDFNERAVQSKRETQRDADGTSAAMDPTKPSDSSPRSLSKNHGRKPVRAATDLPKPRSKVPPTPSQKRSRKAASPANVATKPSAASPGTSSTKRGRHAAFEAQHENATARPASTQPKPKPRAPGDSFSGDHPANAHQEKVVSARPATKPTKPSFKVPGDSSPSGRKTGRRSIQSSKPIFSTSGDNSDGHPPPETQNSGAINGRANLALKPTTEVPGHSLRDGQLKSETQSSCAVAGDDHFSIETQKLNVIATIQELWRRRQSWHRAEKSLTLQCKAVCRRFVGGDKIEANKLFAAVDGHFSCETQCATAVTVAILPLMMARETVEKHRDAVEKELAKLAKALPIWTWVEPIRGVGAGSLAALVGECGDIGSYKSASAVWKRMGLAVINGGRQRRVAGVDALEHGYSPQRRSVAWNIGGGLIGGMGKGPRPKVGEDIEQREDLSPYQKQFIRLLRLEVERVTDTWNGPEHKRAPVEKKGELYESFSSHAANRIKRRIEKQFLAELYGAWRDQGRSANEELKPVRRVPGAPTISAQAERSASASANPRTETPSALIPAKAGKRRAKAVTTPNPHPPAATHSAQAERSAIDRSQPRNDTLSELIPAKAGKRRAIVATKPNGTPPAASNKATP